MARALILAALLILPVGCIGGSDSADDGAAVTGASVPADPAAAANPGGSTDNATYLSNSDYSQAHIHDYWAGAESKELMSEEFETSAVEGAFRAAFAPLIDGRARTSAGSIFFTLPNGTFVPEGTGELRVEIDASAAMDSGGIALAYRAANAAEYVQMDAKEQADEWVIELTPQMADVPHAKKTRWTFRIDAAGDGAVMDGPVNVRIVAVRLFDLEAWPQHADPWDAGNLTMLDLGNSTGSYDYLEQHLIGPDQNDAYVRITLPEGTIVPPETQALVVTLNYERDTNPKNTANGPVILTVKDGATSRGTTVMHGNAIEDAPGERIVYAIPVGGSTWDSPYADTSGWEFQLHAPFGFHDLPPNDRTIDIGGLDTGSGTYDAGVVAYRVLPDWLAEVLPDDIGR